MEVQKSKVLVTWDFTAKADIAFQHALAVNNRYPCDITLLNIVKREEDIKKVEVDIKEDISALKGKYKYEPDYIIKEGSIYTTISEVVNSLGVDMVFMGTHGIKGFQKIIGSHALKVVLKSRAPFIVVKEPPKDDLFNKIVVPVTYRSENKEISKWIDFLHKHFNPKFLMFKRVEKDIKFKHGIENNLIFAKKYMKVRNIEYETTVAPGKQKFYKETIEYANQNNADIILVMTTRGIRLMDFMFGAEEQNYMDNKYQIPVMVTNPRPMKMSGSFSSTGG